MLSQAKPIGTTTNVPADEALTTSHTSGPSHGELGLPERLCHTNCHDLTRAPSAARRAASVTCSTYGLLRARPTGMLWALKSTSTSPGGAAVTVALQASSAVARLDAHGLIHP